MRFLKVKKPFSEVFKNKNTIFFELKRFLGYNDNFYGSKKVIYVELDTPANGVQKLLIKMVILLMKKYKHYMYERTYILNRVEL